MEKLIRECDCVAENFRSGVLEGWGIGYERMKEINPPHHLPEYARIRQLRAQRGPAVIRPESARLHRAYEPVGAPGVGRPHAAQGALPDFIAAAAGASALLSALEYRDRTGKGQMIEMAQLEGLLATMGVAFADFSLNDTSGNRPGTATPTPLPTTCFHARVTTPGAPSPATLMNSGKPWSVQWRTPTGRGTTSSLRWRAVWRTLMSSTPVSASGPPSAPHTKLCEPCRGERAGGCGSNAQDLYYDLNLRARDYVITIDHRPAFDVLSIRGPRYGFRRRPAVSWPPELGQHNREVFGGLLGLSDDELQRLVEEKVLY